MAFRSILVPTDFSETARYALDAAVALAKSQKAELHLVHVFELPGQIAVFDSMLVPEPFWAELRGAAEKRLLALRDELTKGGANVIAHLVDDSPAYAIPHTAERLGCDLIVIGSRGLSGLKHLVLGSVAERTVRLAKCPVLTVKRALAGGPPHFRTILVPTDFSPGAERALELVREIAKSDPPAHVILAHGYGLPIELEAVLLQQGASLIDQLSKQAEALLDAMLKSLQDAGISAEYISRRETPERLIAELARTRKVDLIALGTHGRRGVSRLVLGSIAEAAVRTAECPVLTVRTPEK